MKTRRCINFIVSSVCLFSFVLVSVESYACTGIRIKTEDGNYIHGRTMEFADSFSPHSLIAVPRGQKYIGITPSGNPGMPWETKYALVGFNPIPAPFVDDGLNEKGLYCGGFFSRDTPSMRM